MESIIVLLVSDFTPFARYSLVIFTILLLYIAKKNKKLFLYLYKNMIMQFILNFVFQPRLIFNNILPRVDMLLKKYKYSFMFHMKEVLKKILFL